MPEILDRLIQQLEEKGKSAEAARRIAISALQKSGSLYPGTIEATPKGLQRGKMSPADRAIDRASRRTGRPESDFVYNEQTNRAVLLKF